MLTILMGELILDRLPHSRSMHHHSSVCLPNMKQEVSMFWIICHIGLYKEHSVQCFSWLPQRGFRGHQL